MVSDPELEEAVLSSMMGKGDEPGAKVQSLTPGDFTCPARARIYELLREGRTFDNLDAAMRADGWEAHTIQYITDVFLTPQVPRHELANAVADLRRLTLVRGLCESVDEWRKVAPHLSYAVAVKRLGALIRRSGTLILDQKSSGEPSPR